MFCTDSLVDVPLLFALESCPHIPAHNIHLASLRYLVRKVFDLNRRGHLTLDPHARVVILTDHDDDDLRKAAVEAERVGIC